MGFPAYFTLYGGKEPPRIGASHAAIAPYGPFECGDGEIIFLGLQNEREWERFCETVLERPALADDERYGSNSERVENVDALRQAIEGILAAALLRRSHRAPRRGEDSQRPDEERPRLPAHPQLEARDRWREVESSVGPLRSLIPPATLDGTEPVMAPIPSVGEHTARILADLGYGDDAVAALRGSSAI